MFTRIVVGVTNSGISLKLPKFLLTGFGCAIPSHYASLPVCGELAGFPSVTNPLGLAQRFFTPRVLHMYSMVMMMAVASSGDVASFGGRNGCDGGSCHGRAGLFAKHSCDGGNSCHGGGLLARLKSHKGSCCGTPAPACPAPCATPCPAPCPAPVACPAPCPTACADPCDPCAKKKLFAGLFHRKKKDCCEPACPTTCASACPTAACAAPGAPAPAPAAAPKTMPKAEEPAKKKES